MRGRSAPGLACYLPGARRTPVPSAIHPSCTRPEARSCHGTIRTQPTPVVPSHETPNTADVAGLPAGTGPHLLRHYYASLLIRYGESVKTVQARLGHATAAETLDTNSHLWPDSDDRTREAVDAQLGVTSRRAEDNARTAAGP